ncbi:FMN reductase [Actinomycetota bacterium]
MTRRIVAISAGLGKPSSTRLLADQLRESLERNVTRRGEAVEVEVIELREIAGEITNHMLTGFPSGELAAVIDRVLAADGIIAVTPVFAASYSGLFKSFFDVLDVDALAGKPVLLAATAGTARHSLVIDHAMRPLFAYLRALVTPTGVMAASEDFGTAGLAGRVDRAADEFAALVLAGGQGAVAGLGPSGEESGKVSGTTDRFDTVTDFASLLGDQLR